MFRHNLYIFLEILFLCLALICGCVLGWAMFSGANNYTVLVVSGALFYYLFAHHHCTHARS